MQDIFEHHNFVNNKIVVLYKSLANAYVTGLTYLHLLTRSKPYRLRVDLADRDGAKRYAEYQNFAIDSEANKYRLAVSGYRGDAGEIA